MGSGWDPGGSGEVHRGLAAPVPFSAVQLVIRREQRPPWTVLSAFGDLDVAGAPELRQAVVAAVADGLVHIVLDLSAVDFVDSFGLGVVVGAVKRLRQRDGELAVVCPEPRVRRVFELCDLDRILPLHTSMEMVPAPGAVR